MSRRKRTKAKPPYRSVYEQRIAEHLESQKTEFSFETIKIPYTPPVVHRTYLPDFILPNGVIIEAKGRFLSADRKKHLLVREQNPEYDIRFLFMNPNVLIYKGAKMTVAEWADKHEFKWAKGPTIPKEWTT